MTQNSPHDLDDLSAYLDQALEPRETARLEERLRTDHRLQAELDSLRRTREVLRRTPQMRAPRNFTLSPEMVGAAPRERSRLLPITRVVFALASIFFVVALVGNANYVPAALPAADNVTAFELVEEDPAAGQDAGDSAAGSAAAGPALEEESISLQMAPAAEADPAIEATGETMEAMSPTEESMAITGEEDAASAESAAAEATERSMSDTGLAEEEGEVPGDLPTGEAESLVMADEDKLVQTSANPWMLPALVAGAAAALSGVLMLVLRKK